MTSSVHHINTQEVAMHGATSHLPPAVASCFPGANGSLVDLSYLKGKIRLTGFGRLYKGEEVDWSFRPFKKFEHGAANPDNPTTLLLPQVAADLGISEMLAPHPEFGTNACAINHLRTRIPFEYGGRRVMLLRGYQADIVTLTTGQTFAISVGGCPVGWMFDPVRPDRLLVAHMGLKCLIDRELVTKGKKSRQYKSVIDRMWEMMRLRPGDAERVQVGFAFPIAPLHYVHAWDYPIDGADNKKICEYLAVNFGHECVVGWHDERERAQGRLHLGNIIRGQLTQLGIPLKNIRRLAPPDAVCASGEPQWYVTRGPHGKDPRNLVLVTLYA